MTIGNNQESIKQFKKNLLPPFDNEGWVRNGSISEDSVFADGYSISFLAPQYQGISYYVPNSYAGRTFSLSIEHAEGGKPYIEIIYETESGTSYKGSATGKLENVTIPLNAHNIRCKVSNTSPVTSQMFFKNLQLEESPYCTSFEEHMSVNKQSSQGLLFNGKNQCVTASIPVPSFPFSVEVVARRTGETYSTASFCGIVGWRYVSESVKSICLYGGNKIAMRDYDKSYVNTGVTMMAGRDYKIRLDFTSTTVSIYIDDVLQGEYGYTPSTYVPSEFFIGGDVYDSSTGIDRVFNGMVKMARIYQDGNILHEFDLTRQDTESSTVKNTANTITGTIKNGAEYNHKNAIRKPTVNYAPPLEEWTYIGGARYENGVAVLPSYSAKIESPLIRVDSVSDIDLSGEYFSTKPAPTDITNNEEGKYFSIYTTTLYYDREKNPVKNSWGYTGNGNARVIIGELGKWSNRKNVDPSNSWNFLLGNSVRYFKVIYQLSSKWTQDNLKIRNVMLSSGVDISDFKERMLVNKSVKNPALAKRAFKKYPFTFTRGNPAVLDSQVFGINQPRISEDGIYVEEGTKNMFKPSYNNGDVETIIEGGRDVYVLDASNIDYEDFQTSKAYSCNSSETYAISFLAKWNERLIYEPRSFDSSNVRLSAPSFNWIKDPEPNPDKYQKYEALVTLPAGATKAEFFRWYYTPSNETGLAYLKDIQLEERGYHTSYTENERKKENVAIEDAGRYIDTERGSIEMEFTPLSGDNIVSSNTWGLSDLSCYNSYTGGFLLRRSYGRPNRVELIVVSPVSGINIIQYNDNVGWKNGDTIKYRLDWDKSSNKTILTVNDTTEILVSSMFKTFPDGYRYSLNLGSRGMVNETYGCGNAIYKSLIIRNRNGETTYKL